MPINLGLGQGDPSEISSPKNLRQESHSATGSASKQPVDEQDRIKYGVITEVNENSLVKVRLLDNKGNVDGTEIVNGAFLPLITPLQQIFLLWGSLRRGLFCRIYWRGKLDPNGSTSVEIIGDEHHTFLKKDHQPQEVTTNAYKIFSGGTFG